jgi:acetyltransferase
LLISRNKRPRQRRKLVKTLFTPARTMSIRNLHSLLQPASVALIGASARPGSVGAVVLDNLRSGGFAGPLWPVNPKHAEIAGLRCWPDIASLPAAPELAVVCVPAAAVPGVIAELGARGTRAAIVLSAGLRACSEPGGVTLEQQMLDAARPHLLRILGPNCIGALTPALGLNASFAPGHALPGQLAFVTQSGALATAMLDWSRTRGVGFSHFVSLGDSADVDFGDMLDYLASDPGTRAILLYIESVRSARKFVSAARAAARNKPVIVVKAGRAPGGARAAASHTGALAGSDSVFDAVARRAGMLRVDTLEALFDAAETLAHARPPLGERLAILTNGGGAGVLAADALSLAGGELATLADATLARLDACLPPTWSKGNPVDIVGDAPVGRYEAALDVLLAAPEVDAVLFLHAPTAIVPAADIAQACLPRMARAGKPVLACWLGGEAVAPARAATDAAGVASYGTPERATSAWMQLVAHRRNQAMLRELPGSDDALSERGSEHAPFTPDRERALAAITQAVARGQEWLDPAQVVEVLAAYGIDSPAGAVAHTAEQAAQLAARIGFPVALKVVSPQIVHKSDVGGVVMNLGSGDAVRAAVVAMRQSIARLAPQATVTGFAVQAMVRRPGARELIAGLATDPVFGPVVLFGEGGTTVELRHQHAVALPPLNGPLARELIQRSGCGPLLAALRGQPAVDHRAVEDALVRVARIASDLRHVAELDINPLLADAQGVLALDARIRLHDPDQAPPLAILPYPGGLEEGLQVGGRRLQLRPIRPEDGWRLARFFERVSPRDMQLRFFMARREVPASELARYCQIDYDREMAFIALDPDTGEMAGEARAVCDPDNLRAEFAVHVDAAWQRQGLGHRLMDKLLAWLRSRGTGSVSGVCMMENRGMAQLARRLGFRVSVSRQYPGCSDLDLTLVEGTPVTGTAQRDEALQPA